MRPDPAPQLLNVRQAAALLNLAESTLRGWLCDRRLPFVKVGRRTMLRRADLEAYLEAHTVPAEAPEPRVLTRRRQRALPKPPAPRDPDAAAAPPGTVGE